MLLKVTDFSDKITEARQVQEDSYQKVIVPFVIYNLPNRDCSAGASASSSTVGTGALDNYKKFIDSIAVLLKPSSDLSFAVILEPDAVGNLVTNMNVTKCKEAEDVYIAGIAYAIQALQFDNVAIYIDAAHGNWLGWPDKLEPGMLLHVLLPI